MFMHVIIFKFKKQVKSAYVYAADSVKAWNVILTAFPNSTLLERSLVNLPPQSSYFTEDGVYHPYIACSDCSHKKYKYVDDPYNTNGDCLANK